MKTIEITICKENGSGLLYAMDGQNSYNTLFAFTYREEAGGWLFWLRGNHYPAIFEGGAFPMRFFLDACRAKYLIRGGDALPEGAKVVKGMSYIKDRK